MMILGDSHAASVYPGLADLKNSMTFGLAQTTQAGCPPLLNAQDNRTRKNCRHLFRESILKAREHRVDVIFLHARWFWTYDPEEVSRLLPETVEFIRTNLPGVKIVILGPIPVWPNRIQEVLMDFHLFHPARPFPPGTLRPVNIESNRKADADMKELSEKLRIPYISAYQAICPDDQCRVSIGTGEENLVFVDESHLSFAGSLWFASRIKEELSRILSTP